MVPTQPPSGYSGTPQCKKLGIGSGTRWAILDRPRGWELTDPPRDAVKVRGARAAVDVLIAFVIEPKGLDGLSSWADRIFPAGAIWVAWPRKAGGHVSDVTENLIRDSALAIGLVDTKVAAIDDDWSGLKLVWRKELRRERS